MKAHDNLYSKRAILHLAFFILIALLEKAHALLYDSIVDQNRISMAKFTVGLDNCSYVFLTRRRDQQNFAAFFPYQWFIANASYEDFMTRKQPLNGHYNIQVISVWSNKVDELVYSIFQKGQTQRFLQAIDLSINGTAYNITIVPEYNFICYISKNQIYVVDEVYPYQIAIGNVKLNNFVQIFDYPPILLTPSRLLTCSYKSLCLWAMKQGMFVNYPMGSNPYLFSIKNQTPLHTVYAYVNNTHFMYTSNQFGIVYEWIQIGPQKFKPIRVLTNSNLRNVSNILIVRNESLLIVYKRKTRSYVYLPSSLLTDCCPHIPGVFSSDWNSTSLCQGVPTRNTLIASTSNINDISFLYQYEPIVDGIQFQYCHSFRNMLCSEVKEIIQVSPGLFGNHTIYDCYFDNNMLLTQYFYSGTFYIQQCVKYTLRFTPVCKQCKPGFQLIVTQVLLPYTQFNSTYCSPIPNWVPPAPINSTNATINATINTTINTTINNTTNTTLNTTINVTINTTINTTNNATINTTINATINDTSTNITNTTTNTTTNTNNNTINNTANNTSINNTSINITTNTTNNTISNNSIINSTNTTINQTNVNNTSNSTVSPNNSLINSTTNSSNTTYNNTINSTINSTNNTTTNITNNNTNNTNNTNNNTNNSTYNNSNSNIDQVDNKDTINSIAQQYAEKIIKTINQTVHSSKTPLAFVKNIFQITLLVYAVHAFLSIWILASLYYFLPFGPPFVDSILLILWKTYNMSLFVLFGIQQPKLPNLNHQPSQMDYGDVTISNDFLQFTFDPFVTFTIALIVFFLSILFRKIIRCIWQGNQQKLRLSWIKYNIFQSISDIIIQMLPILFLPATHFIFNPHFSDCLQKINLILFSLMGGIGVIFPFFYFSKLIKDKKIDKQKQKDKDKEKKKEFVSNKKNKQLNFSLPREEKSMKFLNDKLQKCDKQKCSSKSTQMKKQKQKQKKNKIKIFLITKSKQIDEFLMCLLHLTVPISVTLSNNLIFLISNGILILWAIINSLFLQKNKLGIFLRRTYLMLFHCAFIVMYIYVNQQKTIYYWSGVSSLIIIAIYFLHQILSIIYKMIKFFARVFTECRKKNRVINSGEDKSKKKRDQKWLQYDNKKKTKQNMINQILKYEQKYIKKQMKSKKIKQAMSVNFKEFMNRKQEEKQKQRGRQNVHGTKQKYSNFFNNSNYFQNETQINEHQVIPFQDQLKIKRRKRPQRHNKKIKSQRTKSKSGTINIIKTGKQQMNNIKFDESLQKQSTEN